MSRTIPSGQGLTLTASFTDEDGIAVAPTDGQLVITDPTGATTTFPFSGLFSPSTGVFQKLVTPILMGRWTYAFHATETVLAVAQGAFSVAPEDWTPTVDDIGRKMRTRTMNRNGTEEGTFQPSTADPDHQTKPTAEDIARIIEEETGALMGFVGYDIPAPLWQLAHSAALSRVAARVELDYYTEQINSGRSPYEQYKDDRDLEEGRLVSAVRASSGAGEAGGLALGSMLTRPQAAIDSENRPSTSNVVPDTDFPPFTPGWPVGGPAGTSV